MEYVRYPMCYGRFWRVEIGRKCPETTQRSRPVRRNQTSAMGIKMPVPR
jgi:hypothetical protein